MKQKSNPSRGRAWPAVAGPLLWLSTVAGAPGASPVKVGNQLLIDLHYSRGVATEVVDAETQVTAWTNHGVAGGSFGKAATSAYGTAWLAAGGANINPPFVTVDKGGAGINVPEAFGGRSLVASFATPPKLQGNSPYSIEVWLWKNNTATEKIYLDGALVNSGSKTLDISKGTYYPMLFSGIVSPAPTNTSFSLNGAIAAVRVHTAALSAADDVAANNTAGISAVPVMEVAVTNSAPTSVTATTATLNGSLLATTDGFPGREDRSRHSLKHA
jgi:hypothetical protein